MAAQAGLCLIFQKSSKTGLNRVQSQSSSRVMSVSNWLEAQPGRILSVRNGLLLILSYRLSYVCCPTTGLDDLRLILTFAGRIDHILFNMRLIKE